MKMVRFCCYDTIYQYKCQIVTIKLYCIAFKLSIECLSFFLQYNIAYGIIYAVVLLHLAQTVSKAKSGIKHSKYERLVK